jgi:acyl-CoA thioester hydrolase
VETDAMGFAHHASYYHWMEAARVDYMAKAGLKYSQFELMGFALPVAEAGCKYLKPVFFEDEIAVRLWLSKLTDVSMRIEYEMVRKPALETVAKGFTVHPVVNKERRIVRMPAHVKDIFMKGILPLEKRHG